MDPRIRVRIHTKMSWIRNTGQDYGSQYCKEIRRSLMTETIDLCCLGSVSWHCDQCRGGDRFQPPSSSRGWVRPLSRRPTSCTSPRTPRTRIHKKDDEPLLNLTGAMTMSRCSKEKVLICMYTKEGTGVPSLSTGGLVCTRWTKQREGGKRV